MAPPKKPTAASTRKRLVDMAAELSKMRSPCDGCAASVELTTHLDGQLIVADVHHEIRCRQGRDSLRENLISADEVAQALDDTTAARA